MAYREMTDWIFNNLETVSQWLTPPGIKSTLLAEVVRTPTLFLFTPRHLLLPITPYYNVLRDVALEYYNCNKSSGAKSIQHRGALRKYTLQQEVSRLGDKCLRWSCPNSCCQSVAPPPSASLCTCSACLCLNGTTPELCRHTLSRAMPSLHLSPLQLCDRLPVSYPLHYAHFGHVLVTCKPGDSRHAPSPDDRVQRLQEREQKKPCKVLRQSMEYSEVRFPQPSSPPGSDGLAGLRCRTNRTLQFIAMDTVQFSAFAERLGINVWRAPHHTAAAIVESQVLSNLSLHLIGDQLSDCPP
ncbi:TXNDC11 [Cordylochernes scorpioides]|uniref:TXNDC11 n=1 Tax=Cordylochernes scorpioides TaxID=51811 RepID=A0ABY6LSQ7_9ARAC|nr:TXNDC11 [Cordylochernes scorpioides]